MLLSLNHQTSHMILMRNFKKKSMKNVCVSVSTPNGEKPAGCDKEKYKMKVSGSATVSHRVQGEKGEQILIVVAASKQKFNAKK